MIDTTQDEKIKDVKKGNPSPKCTRVCAPSLT